MATRQEILSQLADDHERRISKVLFDLEDDIIAELESATRQVTLNTDLAIQLRPNLKRLIEENYLKEGTRIVSDYDKVVKEYQDYIKRTPIADKFKTLTKPDLAIINQLKQLSFSGFQDVANRFLDEISTEVYKSAIVGKPFPDMVRTIRGQINGVYQRSNEEAINRLVRVVEENKYSSDPAAIKKTQDATKILQTKYAADRVGNNMKKYASQIAHDSLMQFDGQFTKYKAQEAGLTQFKYVGTNITTTREFCRNQLDKVFTEEEARQVWSQSWKGKSGGDPFVDRGGYRCRHSFIPYDTAWDNIDAVQEKVEIKEDGKKRIKPENVSSLSNPIKENNLSVLPQAIVSKKITNRIAENKKDKRYLRDKDGNDLEIGLTDQVYGSVNLKGLDAKTISALDAVLDELDELANKLNVPKIRLISTKHLVKGKKKLPRASMSFGRLYLNPKHMNLDREIRDVDKLMLKRGSDLKNNAAIISSDRRYVKNNLPYNNWYYFDDKVDQFRATMYHEFAHHVHQSLGVNLKNFKTILYDGKEYADLRSMGFDLEKKIKNLRGVKYTTGNNAENGLLEWFADNFALYHMNQLKGVDPKFIEFYKKEIEGKL